MIAAVPGIERLSRDVVERPSLARLHAGLVDLVAERARLDKEHARIVSEIETVTQKLANPNFTQKVPPKVLAEHQQRLVDWKSKLAQVQSALDGLGPV